MNFISMKDESTKKNQIVKGAISIGSKRNFDRKKGTRKKEKELIVPCRFSVSITRESIIIHNISQYHIPIKEVCKRSIKLKVTY